MSGEPAEAIANDVAAQPCDGWDTSDNPVFREFLDHVADLIAHDYVRCMRETANPEDLEAWEKGGHV
jgi:hypothetical protein